MPEINHADQSRLVQLEEDGAQDIPAWQEASALWPVPH